MSKMGIEGDRSQAGHFGKETVNKFSVTFSPGWGW